MALTPVDVTQVQGGVEVVTSSLAIAGGTLFITTTHGLGGPSIPPAIACDFHPDAIAKVSADRGDANVTLVAGVDSPIQKFDTTLTANRTVTLSTTGAINGHTFRIVRTGLGAFTLAVGAAKTIASATAAFVDVSFNGTAWVLTGYGAL